MIRREEEVLREVAKRDLSRQKDQNVTDSDNFNNSRFENGLQLIVIFETLFLYFNVVFQRESLVHPYW